MSTIKATNIQHGSAASPNLVLDSSGNATVAGTLVAGSSMGMRNRIINGDMRIDQRNAGASVTINTTSPVFGMDRWRGLGDTTDGVFTLQQSTTAPSGFTNSALVTVTTADAAIGSTQRYSFQQLIEGFNISDLGWGIASAQTVTLSFQVRSSVTGVFGASIKNNNSSRSYPFIYNINTADTWEQKSITIPGDTSGTWQTQNGTGLIVNFNLGCGSSRLGTANTWSSSNFDAPTGSVALISNLNATWYVTGVQLEVGSVATPFERRQYGQELALCQRYYQVTKANLFIGTATTTGVPLPFFDQMRASPTATPSGGAAVNVTGEYIENLTINGARYTISTSANGYYIDRAVALSAEL